MENDEITKEILNIENWENLENIDPEKLLGINFEFESNDLFNYLQDPHLYEFKYHEKKQIVCISYRSEDKNIRAFCFGKVIKSEK